jgi:hypothetical protein
MISLGIETLSDINLQVAPARKTEVTLQTVEPGYEKPKSGPTTNFVGKHNTWFPFVRVCTVHDGAMNRN